MNWCCCIKVINDVFNSKLFALIAGYLTAKYSHMVIGIFKGVTCELVLLHQGNQ